jgi:hypothetical protein
MFVVTEEEAAAIRAAFDRGGRRAAAAQGGSKAPRPDARRHRKIFSPPYGRKKGSPDDLFKTAR